MRRTRRPELEKAWDKLPKGYKRLLGQEAGIPGWIEQDKVNQSLYQMSEATRRKLLAANHQIATLAVEAAKVLGNSVTATP